MFNIGHSCDRYLDKQAAKVGDTYTCICGVKYTCIRRWPWRKWSAV